MSSIKNPILTRPLIPIAGCGVLLVLLSLLGGVSQAADPLEKGLSLYLDLKLPEALQAFETVAADEAVPTHDRARANQYAALVLVARGTEPYLQAKKKISKMFELDPAIGIDVESVPTRFLHLCYGVSKEMDLLAVHASAEREAVLAVFDFDINAIDEAEKMQALGPGLAQMLVTDLAGVENLKVVERQKIQFVLEELKHHGSGKVDPETAARAGKLIGAGTLMFGSVLSQKDQMAIDIRLVRTETGEIIKAGRIEGKTKKFFELQRDLAELVVEELLPKDAQETALPSDFGSPQTKSLEAALAYSEGIRLMDEGQIEAAYERFSLAVNLSPDFAAPKRRMDGLKPFLEL